MIHHKHLPGVVFLSKTKNKKTVLQNVQAELGYDQLFTVEPLRQCGGLAFLFMDDFSDCVMFSSNHVIDADAVIDGVNFFMMFSMGTLI